MNKEYMQECINYGLEQNKLGFSQKDDIKKAFLGFTFACVKKSLTEEELTYYVKNYDELKALETRENLNTIKLCKYIQFFHKHNIALDSVIFNKKVVINADKCKQKIIDTLKFDFDSFSLKFGNINLRAAKEKKDHYTIHKYVGKKQSETGYVELYQLEVPNLELKEVTW